MKIKKVFNLEEDLTSDEFIENKQDMVSDKCQLKHPDFLCKVYTYCTADKKFVIHTTEEKATMVGALSKLLAHRPVSEQALLSLDNDMVNTWEIIITADTDLPDYITALNVAQSKADEMMEADKSKMPIVTVIDYRWGNPVTQIVPTIFGDTDENGNLVPPAQPVPSFNIGNTQKGKEYLINYNDVINYDGTDPIIIPNADWMNLSGDFEISLDFNATDISDEKMILSTHLAGTGHGYFIEVNDGKLLYWGSNNETVVSDTLSINTDYHLVIKRIDGTITFSLNDEIIYSVDYSDDFNSEGRDLWIGNTDQSNDFDYSFKGVIKNIDFNGHKFPRVVNPLSLFNELKSLSYEDMQNTLLNKNFTLEASVTYKDGPKTSYEDLLNSEDFEMAVFLDSNGHMGIFTAKDRDTKFGGDVTCNSDHVKYSTIDNISYSIKYGNHEGGGNYNHMISLNSFSYHNLPSDYEDDKISTRVPDGVTYQVYIK